ncbi:MAG: hypothetical protein J7521_07690 [Caulobacter sp.]|nr:hypothetical protein [Caulobacter sp.]
MNSVRGLGLSALAMAAVLSLAAAPAAMAQTDAPADPVADLASADAPADGTVSLSSGAVAAGVGFVWGGGDLEFAGKAHPFKITGLSVVDVGVASINATGTVHNLKRLQDFAGTYTAFSAGATVAGGGGLVVLRNQNGVVLKLKATSAGLRLTLAPEGIKVRLKG